MGLRNWLKRRIFHSQLDFLHRALWGWPIDHLTPIDELMASSSIHDATQKMVNSARFRWDHRNTLPAWPTTKWVCTEAFGLKFWVNLNDSHVSWGILNNDWENEEVKFIVDQLKAGDVMLDIGANVGVYTLTAARKVGPSGHVFSIEPRKDTAEYLRRAIAENSFENRCTVFEVAVGSGPSRGIMGGDQTNPGASFVRDTGSGETSIVSLDDLPIRGRRVKALKVDIEGYEPMMLRGATEFFKDQRPIVLSELFPRALKEIGGSSAKEYLEQWKALDYKSFRLVGSTIGQEILHDDIPALETINEPINIVCLPNK